MAGIVKHYLLDVQGNLFPNRSGLTRLMQLVPDRIPTTAQLVEYRRIVNQPIGWRRKLREVWPLASAVLQRREIPASLTEYRHYRKRANQPFHRMADSNWRHRARNRRADPLIDALRANLPTPPPFRRPVQRVAVPAAPPAIDWGA